MADLSIKIAGSNSEPVMVAAITQTAHGTAGPPKKRCSCDNDEAVARYYEPEWAPYAPALSCRTTILLYKGSSAFLAYQ